MEKEMVFVAASITGGRETLPFVKFIVRYIEQHGYKVPSQHNAADDPIQAFIEEVGDPTATTPVHFRRYNNRWIEKARFFVAEVSIPSSGLGAEFEHCILKPGLGLNPTPMLCVYHADRIVSPHLTGIEEWEKNLVWFRPYRDEVDIARVIDEFLAAFE